MAQGIKSGLGGLAGAAGQVKGFLESAYVSPVKTLGDATLGTMAAIAGKIPLIGPLLALPFEGLQAGLDTLLSTYDKGAERIKTLGNLALRLGTDIETVQVFGEMTGDINTGSAAFFKFQQQLGRANLAAAGANNEFTRLGLSGQELAKMLPLDALDATFQKLRGLDANARALAVRGLFGRQGLAVMPGIAKQAGEFGSMEEIRERLRATGQLVTAADVANVKLAGYAKKYIEGVQTGITNQITRAVAPVLAELANTPGGLFDLSDLAERILEGFENAATAVATFVDSFGDLQLTWKLLGTGWDFLVGGIIEGIGRIIAELPSLGAAFLAALPIGHVARAGLLQGLGFMEEGGIGQSLIDRGEALREKAQENYQKIRQQMRDQGLTAAQDYVAKLFEGVWERFTQQGKQAMQDVYQGLRPLVEELEKSVEGPLEHFANKAEDLKRLAALPAFQPGQIIDRDKGLLERGAFAMFGKLQGALGGPESPFAAAMEASSKEAYSTILRHTQKPESVEDEMRRLLEQANAQREKEIELGERILLAVQNGGLPVFGGP